MRYKDIKQEPAPGEFQFNGGFSFITQGYNKIDLSAIIIAQIV